MAFRKTYRTVIPVDRGAPDSELVWYARESFDRAASADSLVLVAFTDLGEVAAEDIPPKVEKQLGKPATDFVWRSFEGVGERRA